MTEQRWRYAAEEASGGVTAGVVFAASRDAAATQLKARALRPLQIEPAPVLFRGFESGGRVSEPTLARCLRRLCELLKAGLPLAAALRIGAEQARTATERRWFLGLHERVRAGAAFGEAIAAGPKVSRLMQALVAAGEAVGDLGGQLGRLADYYEDRVRLRREVVAQLVYPAALSALVVATLVFLSYFILPQFEQVFATADASPPPETRFVLGAGAFIRTYGWTLPIGFLGGLLALRAAAARNRRRLEAGVLRVPILGRFLATVEAAAFFRTLATLLLGGMALSRSLAVAIETVGNATIRDALVKMETKVRGGARLGRSLRDVPAIPRDLVSFIEIGDETGALGAMSEEAAKTAETRLREQIKTAMALLAPALTALMGLVTAGVIAAVMSGVLSLNDAVN